jgi:hypothetical protein
MNFTKKTVITIIIGLVLLGGFRLGRRQSNSKTDIFISTAHARVGRPLTPVSVAGVSRRTSRRVSRRH